VNRIDCGLILRSTEAGFRSPVKSSYVSTKSMRLCQTVGLFPPIPCASHAQSLFSLDFSGINK